MEGNFYFPVLLAAVETRNEDPIWPTQRLPTLFSCHKLEEHKQLLINVDRRRAVFQNFTDSISNSGLFVLTKTLSNVAFKY